jgi:hypothetical protein
MTPALLGVPATGARATRDAPGQLPPRHRQPSGDGEIGAAAGPVLPQLFVFRSKKSRIG